jgi:hypothetical protein
MKKQYIPAAILLLLLVFSVVSYKHSTTFRRQKYISFLKNNSRSSFPRRSADRDKNLADQPEMAALQDFYKTFDPQTGTVPRERLLAAYLQQKNHGVLKPVSNGLSWTGYPADMGGRTRMIMFDPNDPNHNKVWAGGVTGGLWYNNDITNPGSSWVPVGDLWSCLAIRCMTYDPIDTQTFYLGTGEPETSVETYRESSGLGNGIWKSTDGGHTWNVLPSTANFAYISKIIVRNESGHSVIYAGVVSGRYHGIHPSQPSDGLFRSSDEGVTWQQVLPNIDGQSVPYSPSDVAINSNGRIFVGTMPNLENAGAATILYSDTGTVGTWTVNTTFRDEIVSDTAKTIPGRVVLGTAPSDPNVVYALIAQGFNNSLNGFNYYYCYRIYRSGDQGETWARKTIPPDANGQPNFAYLAWHALDIAVDPNNPDKLYIGGLDVQKSTNAGESWVRLSDWSLMYYGGGPGYVHADQHAMIYKPGSSSELVLGSDGGVFYTANANSFAPIFEEHNTGYNTLQFYTGAIYPVAGTNEFLGGLQDNGSLRYTGTPLTIYDMVSGGDGAYAFYDKNEPNLSISSIYYNQYITFDAHNLQNYITDFYQSGVFVNPADYDYRNNILYANACDFVGNFLDCVLCIHDITTYFYYGDYVGVHTGAQDYFSAVRWSPYSPTGNTILFLGTQSGQLFRISHAESNPVSTEITGSNFPIGSISSIDVYGSEDTLLVTFSNYGVSSVFISDDGGQTWKGREGNLPDIPVRWGIFHPENSRQAMLATEAGIWTTINLDENNVVWTQDIDGMANVRVDMLSMRDADRTVLAATHGRGFFTATWDVILGTNDKSGNVFSVYPNPVSEILNVYYKDNKPGDFLIRIFDPTGKTVFEKPEHSSGSSWSDHLPVTTFQNGIYYVTVYENGKSLRTEKIMKY